MLRKLTQRWHERVTGFGAPRWRVNFVRGVFYPEVVHIGPAVEVDLKNEEIGMTLPLLLPKTA